MCVSQGSAKVVENPKVEKPRSRDGAICRRIVEVCVQFETHNQLFEDLYVKWTPSCRSVQSLNRKKTSYYIHMYFADA